MLCRESNSSGHRPPILLREPGRENSLRRSEAAEKKIGETFVFVASRYRYHLRKKRAAEDDTTAKRKKKGLSRAAEKGTGESVLVRGGQKRGYQNPKQGAIVSQNLKKRKNLSIIESS